MITDTQIAQLNARGTDATYTDGYGQSFKPFLYLDERDFLGLELAADQVTLRRKVQGRKDDSGKVRMELLADLPRALEGVAEVLTWAVTKKTPKPYEPGSWLNVDDFFNRYRGALGRHLGSLDKGGPKSRDKETDLYELAHIATNALFLLEKLKRNEEGLQ